ncbi:UbiX family flavin prenyltransferase [Pseudidiomarina gelatinasegens]|jgi:4-hydroxy-3-polyprenylbenzoate decarboxylase|uniref:Flavin prenyltransferase UbiX n=1 Tax=Pseudidiomarina gelatinasegens TaxID=2487740 RepID=A0A443YY43_9GAMM|nr:flavin prenyltransferase UbiX [Pseudidiomarina gelatinasegens]RWU09001.1 UbiX family flavin prenyltransferase [Pseudidiomarina gelatinasegens]|tara:strand:+ start:637 stop:1257 length:621 start_codon:yes stop_codon:yes gene_type:complete
MAQSSVTLAITGASGAPYAVRLLECLLAQNQQVHLLMSSAARVVFATEIDWQLPAAPKAMAKAMQERFGVSAEQLHVYGKEEWFSPVASGSAAPTKMVVCPCSTGTLSAIAHGASDNLIERAADVVMKERGQLILLPREMPLSAIHLENMYKLAQLGVTIMPAAPGFYHQPKSINDLVDFVVARILDHLGLEQTLQPRWGYGEENK